MTLSVLELYSVVDTIMKEKWNSLWNENLQRKPKYLEETYTSAALSK
jgi:hypothetical protein